MMAAVLYVVGAADPLDQHPVGAAPSTCAAPVALRNGDFASPLIADGVVATVTTPGWQPGPLTLRNDRGQHAQLSPGTIHQDVTTVPGQSLRWELRHRGGTLAVLIGSPTGPLEPTASLQLNKYAPDVVFSPLQTIGSTGRKFKLILTLHDRDR